MFRSMNRILRWTKGYHRRLYLGSLCSFLATWAAAGPVMLAAWALGLGIESAQEGTALDAIQWRHVIMRFRELRNIRLWIQPKDGCRILDIKRHFHF